ARRPHRSPSGGTADLLLPQHHGRGRSPGYRLGLVLQPSPKGIETMTRWLVVSIILTAGAFAASAYVYFFEYDSLPEQIAVHWNINGEPDRIVPKSEAWTNFWLCPFVMVLMVVLTIVLPWISPKQFEVERFRPTWEYVMTLVVGLFAFIHVVLLAGSWGQKL